MIPLSTGLGQVLAGILDAAALPRAVIAGGDTSGHAMPALGVDALSANAEAAQDGKTERNAWSRRRLRRGMIVISFQSAILNGRRR